MIPLFIKNGKFQNRLEAFFSISVRTACGITSISLLVLFLFSNSFAYEFKLNQKDKNLIEKSTQKSR